jgi:dephospho-CoA kinase
MAKVIFGLVGQLASGKGATKKYIEEKYSGQDCRFSSILRDVLDRVGVPIDRGNLQKVSLVLRQAFGDDLLAKAIAADAGKMDADIVTLDGVRRFTDIKYLRELPNFKLIAIVADPKLRYERLVSRNENVGDNEKTFEQFTADNEAEADREIPEVIKTADFLIDNNGDWDNLYKQIDEIIKITM